MARPPRCSQALACSLLALALVCAAQVQAQGGSKPQEQEEGGSWLCPPRGFDSAPAFNASSYVERPWFVQKQTPLSYQPRDQLFCVRARYKPLDPSKGPEAGLRVFNYANRGQVNGPPQGTSGNRSQFQLIALPAGALPPSGGLLQRARGAAAGAGGAGAAGGNSSTAASKLQVGPEALRRVPAAFGPYWVVYYDGDRALVTGGAPRYRGTLPGTCTSLDPSPASALRPFERFTQGGLWLFSRMPVDPTGAELLEKKARELGYDTSELAPVQQEGCRYEGAEP